MLRGDIVSIHPFSVFTQYRKNSKKKKQAKKPVLKIERLVWCSRCVRPKGQSPKRCSRSEKERLKVYKKGKNLRSWSNLLRRVDCKFFVVSCSVWEEKRERVYGSMLESLHLSVCFCLLCWCFSCCSPYTSNFTPSSAHIIPALTQCLWPLNMETLSPFCMFCLREKPL